MRELYPDDPSLEQFSHRYSTPTFNPTAIRPIISPSQTRPKATYPQQQPQQQQQQPPPERHETPTRHPDTSATNSPKRPFDDLDDDLNRPRKFMRGESPLKALSGRRTDQQKRPQTLNGSQPGGIGGGGQYRPQGSPAPLPRDIVYLLSVIPPASAYTAGRFSPEKLADILRRIDLPGSIGQIPPPSSVRGLGMGQNLTGMQRFSGKDLGKRLYFLDTADTTGVYRSGL